jgi:KDO2-lipid IV(A) lauroyltransferase
VRLAAIVRERRLTTAMKKKRPPTIVDEKIHRIILRCMQLVGCMPPPTARKLGNLIGDAAFWLDRKHRRITTDNLAYALGDELDVRQRWGLARDIFRNLGQILFEVGWFLSATPDALNRCIRIDGLENIQAVSERGKGVLIITAHLGNWELLSIVGKYLPMPINVLYRPLDFMPLDLFFNRLRARFGAKLIPSRKAMLKIVRALKKKEAVTILMDQSVDWYDGVWVDFFGRRTATSIGVAMIAMKTGAPVVPVFLYRERSGFRAVFDKAIDPVVTGDRTRDIERNTLNFSRAIEKGIRRHPEQWFWVHRRWKNKPYCPWPRIVS